MRRPITALISFLFCFQVFPGPECNAQTLPGYQTISTTQGLSQGMIFDLLQDHEGFIWIATKNGLNRFDGYDFKVFSNDAYNEKSLSSNTIIKLFEDSKGYIWAGTEDAGLNIYDKKTGYFYRIQHRLADASSISGNAIRLIEGLPNGKVLVATDGAGLNLVELKKEFFTNGANPLVTRLSLPDNAQVYGIGKDNNGTIWIGGMNGSVYKFNPVNNGFTLVKDVVLLNNGYYTPDKSILINGSLFLYDGKKAVPLFDTNKKVVGNILFKPREALWENFHRELYFYDVSKLEPGKPPAWNLQLPESTRIVYPFIADRSGLIWSGSVGYGLRKYNIGVSEFKIKNPGISVRWIVPVSENEIFTGDHGYGWKLIKNGGTDNTPFSKISSVTRIDNFIITKKGDYWIKSDRKGYYKYDPLSEKLIFHPEINAYDGEGNKQPMLEDSKGVLWFPGRGGAFTRYYPSTGRIDSFTINNDPTRPMFSKSLCTAIYEDGQGAFWIGTQDGFASVVFKGATKNPSIKWYHNNTNSRNSLTYNHVSSLMDDPMEPGKYLWICTKGGGLNRLNKNTGDFFHLTTKNGLPHDVVYGILPDGEGNIWGSTNNGIFCLLKGSVTDSSQWQFRKFSKAHGLQDDEFNTGAYARLPDGRLAFGGINGLNVFDPKEVLGKKFMPGVFITNILINNEPVIPGDKTNVLLSNIEYTKGITLNYKQDILTLEFSSLDFTAPGENKYRYQLTGIDKNWVESGNRRSATYLHLPAGTYHFKVQGSNSEGLWSNKITELQVSVLPPWWKTWWAYLVYVLLLAIAIRARITYSVNKAKLQSQLSFEKLEAKRAKELDTIKTQLYTNITHEFRTPLTVILGMAKQVMDKPAEHLSNGMNMIIRNGEHLLNLVNEMLNLSKLETGKMQLQLSKAEVIHFLRYVVETFHSLAESQQKQLHFLSEIDFLYLEFDQEKMRQIVSNLLTNALKFTPEKGNVYITISENLLKQKGEKTILVIKVKDTGIGIPQNQLPHIFDRFYQLDNSHTRKTEGTGIGLALTKELVKLMEGEIMVKSPPAGANKGTEFTVLLPLKKLPAFENEITYELKENKFFRNEVQFQWANHTNQPEQQNSKKPLILLVEDNADVVAYTASCLPDYRLAVAQDGREGFEIACQYVPDLVITDVMMPLVDGFTMCRQLRSDERTSHVPIIMLTAKADMESRIEGLQHGADVFIEKPFNREELLVRIKKLLEIRQSLQEYYLKKAGIALNFSSSATVKESVIQDTALEDEFVVKIRKVIENNLSEPNFTVEQLCKLVFMSHSQLHRKLEALTGCPPNKFIRIIRLNKAKTLLQNTSSSIASIAMDCGYNDPGYFARVFKQEYQLTPQEWRGNN